jgi:hypothetical protein
MKMENLKNVTRDNGSKTEKMGWALFSIQKD